MDYLRLQKVSQTQLMDKGAAIIFTRQGSNTYNPANGQAVLSTDTGVFTYYGIQMSITDSYIDGKTRKFSDQYRDDTGVTEINAKVYISPACVDAVTGAWDFQHPPLKGDSVDVFGTIYVVDNVQPLNPTGVVMGYEVELV